MALNITFLEAWRRLLAEAKEKSQGECTRLYDIAVTTEEGKLEAPFQGLVYRMLGRPLVEG